jgi:hypothetical protein
MKGKLKMTNTKDAIEFLLDANVAIQDNICVFCSSRFDRWDSICRKCKDYKGVMNIVDAVEYYGTEIIGL